MGVIGRGYRQVLGNVFDPSWQAVGMLVTSCRQGDLSLSLVNVGLCQLEVTVYLDLGVVWDGWLSILCGYDDLPYTIFVHMHGVGAPFPIV